MKKLSFRTLSLVFLAIGLLSLATACNNEGTTVESTTTDSTQMNTIAPHDTITQTATPATAPTASAVPDARMDTAETRPVKPGN